MSTAEETPLATSQADAPVVESMPPPEIKQPETNKSVAIEKKPRLTRACDTCRQKKLRCGHRQIIVEDDDAAGAASAGKRQQKAKTPAPSQAPNQDGSSGVNAIDLTAAGPSQSQDQSTQAASARPRRQGAGKRKLPEAFTESGPSQRTKRVAATAVSQKSQRKKQGLRERKQSEPAPAEVPDTPPSSDEHEPVTEPPQQQQPQPPPPFTDNANASISMAWHGCLSNSLKQRIEETRQKWERTLATIEKAQEQWQEVIASMEATTDYMDRWTKSFVEGK